MKVKMLSLLAGAGTLAMASVASASFVGIEWEVSSAQDADGNPMNVYHIYAAFDGSNPDARVSAWGSAPAGSTWTMGTNDPNGFYSIDGVFGYQDALLNWAHPAGAEGIPGVGAQSFLTIGRRAGDGQSSLQLSPGLFGLGEGENLWHDAATNGYIDGDGPHDAMGDGVVFSGDPTNDFNTVGWSVDNYGESRILLAQLGVGGGAAAGGGFGIDITGSINWIPELGGESNFETFTINTIVPAPGALALLGVAGLVGVRRRRN